MIEIKRGRGTGDWHVHYHILCHGRFIDQQRLSNEWLKASGDSYIVDVRMVDDKAKAIGYACKYASQPLDPSCLKVPADVCDCVLALRGRRLCNTFGDWRGVELERRDTDPGSWREVGPLDALLQAAERGCDTARHWVRTFSGRVWGEVTEGEDVARDSGRPAGTAANNGT